MTKTIKRYVLTGMPGAGKTSIIRHLQNLGYCVVEESATDIITAQQAQGIGEPWENHDFVDKIVSLQKQRQLQAKADIQFFDRCPIDTYALSLYLNMPPSKILLQELDRIKQKEVYQKKVFFIENLGFITPTEVRKISFEESLRFEKIHEEVYRAAGYELIRIAATAVAERAEDILSALK